MNPTKHFGQAAVSQFRWCEQLDHLVAHALADNVVAFALVIPVVAEATRGDRRVAPVGTVPYNTGIVVVPASASIAAVERGHEVVRLAVRSGNCICLAGDDPAAVNHAQDNALNPMNGVIFHRVSISVQSRDRVMRPEAVSAAASARDRLRVSR